MDTTEPELTPEQRANGLALAEAIRAAQRESRNSRLRTLIAPILARTEGQIGTHSPDCYQYHVGCLAVAVRAAISD
jgi:hypothetical protein